MDKYSEFRVTFKTGNAEFDDNLYLAVSRILLKISQDVKMEECLDGNIRDINGNSIGNYEFIE
jgi:hypothetical protein